MVSKMLSPYCNISYWHSTVYFIHACYTCSCVSDILRVDLTLRLAVCLSLCVCEVSVCVCEVSVCVLCVCLK